MTPARRGVAERALDLLLAAFAAWTLVYQVCVLARLSTTVALVLWGVALAGVLAAMLRGTPTARRDREPAEPCVPVPGVRVLQAGGAALAVASAYLFAFTETRWAIVWGLWAGAAACGVAVVLARRRGADGALPARMPVLERIVTAAWMLGLATLALALLDPDDDDAYYVRLIGWISEHGTFPVRDIMFGDGTFPALYHPPIASYDALLGALSRLTSIEHTSLAYYVMPPVGAALAVLALRRLLHSWQVPLAPVALSVALVFLLATAQANETYGAFAVGRLWQGKALLLAVLVPVLFALLHDFGRRPSRRGAARLAAAGIAGVGLSTTGIFLIPLIAFGCMAAVAPRSWRTALAGLAATAAYPLAAGLVTKALGGRVPDNYSEADVVAPDLAHIVLNPKYLAALGIVALLVAPALIPRPLASRMVAVTVLIVALLFAPRVPLAIFELTDLGRVLWRLLWAVPVAALVGVLAVGLLRARLPLAIRLVPAGAIVAFMLWFGLPPWGAKAPRGLFIPPVHKRFPEELRAARTALAAARPGDLVWAERKVSQTVGILEPRVTTVNPRGFFVTALAGEPGIMADARKRLHILIGYGPTGLPGSGDRIAYDDSVADARALGVDVACPRRDDERLVAALELDGWERASESPEVVCLRP